MIDIKEEDLDSFLDEEKEYFENLSVHSCNCCGNRLLLSEYRDYEDRCNTCMWEETSGTSIQEDEQEL